MILQNEKDEEKNSEENEPEAEDEQEDLKTKAARISQTRVRDDQLLF